MEQIMGIDSVIMFIHSKKLAAGDELTKMMMTTW